MTRNFTHSKNLFRSIWRTPFLREEPKMKKEWIDSSSIMK
jgi:hypothetical protein